MDTTILVSVIVPIYNVEEYIDRCLDSLVKQSYGEIEIILVNDGSSDGSLQKAQIWEKKDPRIRLINQENQGAGPTRMKGLSAAHGRFVAFVDSDDSVHPDFIKRMLEKALEQKAEVVYCNVEKIWIGHKDRIENIRFPVLSERGFDAYEYPEILNKCSCWIWNKLYAKELWERLKINQPADTVEDICTTFVLLAKAQRIAQVNGEPLYYYYQRKDSLSFDDTFPRYFKNAIEIAEENCEKYNIDAPFRYYVGKTFGDSLSFVKLHFSDRTELADEIAEMEEYFQIYFSGGAEKSTVVFGSFSLRTMVKEAYYYVPEYFGFSSLISAMHPPMGMEHVLHQRNPLRQDALHKEFMGVFKERLSSDGDKLNFLIFDFLEESHDIIELTEGVYVTKSDAYEESNHFMDTQAQIIASGTTKFFKLWHESCAKLQNLLERVGFSGKIILTRNRLTENYKKAGVSYPFKRKDKIRHSNQIIERLEDIFRKYFNEVILLDAVSEKNYFTDFEYTHGCNPRHLNVEAYAEAGKNIREALKIEMRDKR